MNPMRVNGNPSLNHQELMWVVFALIDVKSFTSIDRKSKVTALLKQREQLGCLPSGGFHSNNLDHAHVRFLPFRVR